MKYFTDIFPVLLVAIGATVMLCTDFYVLKNKKKLFVAMLLLLIVFSVSSLMEKTLHEGVIFHPLRLFCSMVDYSLKPIIALLFYIAVTDSAQWKKWLWFLPGVNCLVQLIAIPAQWINGFPNLVFKFTENNYFLRGTLGYTSFIVSGVILLLLLVETTLTVKEHPLSYTVLIWSIVFVNVICVILELYFEAVLLFPILMFLSFIFYYLYHSYHSVKAHEREIVTQNQIDIMVSQIQPHFLYNTLNSIYHLCAVDAEKAQKTIDEFSTYLRSNLRSLGETHPIPFEEELSHTKTYLEIEKLRFGDRVKAIFQIETTDFKLPSLTLQPLVENAIKHGICQKEEGGTVIVSTKEDGNFVFVTVKDDGIGFDVSILERTDGGNVGFRNVKNRMERMGVGSLSVTSTPGIGTEVIMKVKKTI